MRRALGLFFVTFAATALMLSFPAPAKALTAYTSLTDWENAVTALGGTITTEDFESEASTGSFPSDGSGGYEYTTDGGLYLYQSFSNFGIPKIEDDPDYTGSDFNARLMTYPDEYASITTPETVCAFGALYADPWSTSTFGEEGGTDLSITFLGDSVTTTFYLKDYFTYGDTTPGFFGVVGGPGEEWDTVMYTANSLNTWYESFGVDDVVWATGCAPVPEPSTLLLLGAGLSGLAWFGWRRKNA